jgi:uncharacterized membrane protein YkvI
MSIIIYLFEFQLPMCSLNPEFLKRDCGAIPVAEIISGKIEFFSKHQRFLIATESSKYLLILVLYVCVILCEFGTAISKIYACFCYLFKIIMSSLLCCYECQLKLFDQNIICNCHFPNNFLVCNYNVVVVYSSIN